MLVALLFSNAVTVNTKSPPLPILAAGIVIVSLTTNPVPPWYIVTDETAPPDTVTFATNDDATPEPEVALAWTWLYVAFAAPEVFVVIETVLTWWPVLEEGLTSVPLKDSPWTVTPAGILKGNISL